MNYDSGIISPAFSKEKLQRHCAKILYSFLIFHDLPGSVAAFEETFNSEYVEQAVEEFLNLILVDCKLVVHCGRLIAELLRKKTVTLLHVVHGLRNIISLGNQVLVDYPQVWTDLANTLNTIFTQIELYSEFETIFLSTCPEPQHRTSFLSIKKLLKDGRFFTNRNAIASSGDVPVCRTKENELNSGKSMKNCGESEIFRKAIVDILNRKKVGDYHQDFIELSNLLKIQTTTQLKELIKSILDMAMEAPAFSNLLAILCRDWQFWIVNENGKDLSFRILLLNACQTKFECDLWASKSENQVLLACEEQEIRQKKMAFFKFLGELFKVRLLSCKIILDVICKLCVIHCETSDDIWIGCLSSLFITAGEMFEEKNPGCLEPFLEKIQEIVDNCDNLSREVLGKCNACCLLLRKKY